MAVGLVFFFFFLVWYCVLSTDLSTSHVFFHLIFTRALCARYKYYPDTRVKDTKGTKWLPGPVGGRIYSMATPGAPITPEVQSKLLSDLTAPQSCPCLLCSSHVLQGPQVWSHFRAFIFVFAAPSLCLDRFFLLPCPTWKCQQDQGLSISATFLYPPLLHHVISFKVITLNTISVTPKFIFLARAL